MSDSEKDIDSIKHKLFLENGDKLDVFEDVILKNNVTTPKTTKNFLKNYRMSRAFVVASKPA